MSNNARAKTEHALATSERRGGMGAPYELA